MIRLFSQNLTYASIPETTYHYRVYGASAMSNMQGLIAGYFELVDNVMKMPSVTYMDTFTMRLKIARVMFSWYIRNKDIAGLINIFRLFTGTPKPIMEKPK